MSYQNIYVKRSKKNVEVHLWDDKSGYSKFNYKNYAYLKSPSGTYRSIYGDKLKKTSFWTAEDLQKGNVFESDVPIETKVLIDKYGESDDISEGHREVYFDIEVDSKNGFPEWRNAQNEITSIALYDKIIDSYFVFVVSSDKKHNSTHEKTFVETFESEEEMLQRFYQKYIEINPTILSGWNIDGFDVPYLYSRTVKLFGYGFANSLSPIGIVQFNEHKKRFKIAGVSCLDYLWLYKFFTFKQQSSYRLDYIGQLEVEIGKVEYTGSLDDLYKNDIHKFIEYNLNDVKIIKALDDKLKFINLVKGIAHLGHIPYEDAMYSSRYLEGAILVHMRKLGLVAPNKPMNDYQKDVRFSGAFVKEPVPGRYDWVYDLDLTSMYPSIMRTLNISPETKIGKLVGWDANEYIKGTPKTYTLEINGKPKGSLNNNELDDLFRENKMSVGVNGVLYRNDKQGLIPSILTKWFEERKEYRKLAKQFSDKGDVEQYEYFHRRQHIQKIMLNSLYGTLGLPVFRFYDLDNAECVTTCGQELIKYTQKIANYFYNKELGDTKDHVIYCDTDSIFCSVIPLIEHRKQNVGVKETIRIATEVQDFINKSYDLFAKKFLNCDNHEFHIKQELVSKSAFWVTKKRYGQWIINDGGIECDKLDIKGLDIVKSNFPTAFKSLMTGVLRDILSHVDKETIDAKILDMKNNMKHMKLSEIASPTGVKGLAKFVDKSRGKFDKKMMFTKMKKGTPVHVKAALIYNDLLKHYGLNKYEKIKNSGKIKWVYLKDNPFKIKQIAFKGYNDPPEIMDYIRQYIDYDKLFKSQLKKKVDMFYSAMGWYFPIYEQSTLERFF